jgi:Mg2+ and Co2+ transporter CorA
MNGMATIDIRVRAYADARERLEHEVRELEAEIAAAKRARIKRIARLAGRAASAKTQLALAIEDNAALFQRPRTVVIDDVKIGIRKGRGRIVIADRERTVALIRKHLAPLFDELVKVTETPIRAALERLAPAALRRIGVEIADTRDEVVIRPATSAVEKLIDKLFEADELNAGTTNEKEVLK